MIATRISLLDMHGFEGKHRRLETRGLHRCQSPPLGELALSRIGAIALS